MSDPRERVETKNFCCQRERDPVRLDPDEVAWEIGGTNFSGEAGWADWPEVVAFATAILAADSQWREQNAPTLAELRERYPAWRIGPIETLDHEYSAVIDSVECDGTVPRNTGVCRRKQSPWFPIMWQVREWLAAELAKEGEERARDGLTFEYRELDQR